MSFARPVITTKIEELMANRYAAEIEGMPLKDIYYQDSQISHDGTALHPTDLYLLVLLFKEALQEQDFQPLIEDIAENALYTAYTALNVQTAYQDMSQKELALLVAKNQNFKRQLQHIRQSGKSKFSMIFSSIGMDAHNSSHYINANFECRNDGITVSVDDSFIEALREACNSERVYVKRLEQLFRGLLAPLHVTLTVNQAIQGQAAANCGIHAVINKVNHEYGFNLDPRALTATLRRGIEASYEADLSTLRHSIRAIITNRQTVAVKPMITQSRASQVSHVASSASTSSLMRHDVNQHRSIFTPSDAKRPVSSFRSQDIKSRISIFTPPVKSQSLLGVPAVVISESLREACEVVYTQATDAIWKSNQPNNIKMAAIRNLFLADNSKPTQPVSAFRPLVPELNAIIANAQRSLQQIEERGSNDIQFASALRNIRDQHKALQNTLFQSLNEATPVYRR